MWVRLDDMFPVHDKIVVLTDKAFRVHIRALCLSANRKRPFLLRDHLAGIQAGPPQVKQLVDVKVWHRHADECPDCVAMLEKLGEEWPASGYVIHDWIKYQRADISGAARQKKWRDGNVSVTDGVTDE